MLVHVHMKPKTLRSDDQKRKNNTLKASANHSLKLPERPNLTGSYSIALQITQNAKCSKVQQSLLSSRYIC